MVPAHSGKEADAPGLSKAPRAAMVQKSEGIAEAIACVISRYHLPIKRQHIFLQIRLLTWLL